MALDAAGSGTGIIQTFPGSGINFTNNNIARIKVLTYSNWSSSGITASWVPTPRVNPVPALGAGVSNIWTATSANGSDALDNYNPNAYLSHYGWECRRQTIDYLSSAFTIGPRIFGPMPGVSYRIVTSIYWQGSEVGNCGNISGTVNETNFLNAVQVSNGTPSSNCGQSPDVYCTWDLWAVHVRISTDGSSITPPPIMVTIYDDPLEGGTGQVLNTLAGVSLS
jgi:hypothetical protein